MSIVTTGDGVRSVICPRWVGTLLWKTVAVSRGKARREK